MPRWFTFPRNQVGEGGLCGGGRGYLHKVAHHSDAHAAGVERVGVPGLYVIAAGSALVDNPIGVNQIVVADVPPASCFWRDSTR